jgi:DNA (cytosine-5)-methyltransferase 1
VPTVTANDRSGGHLAAVHAFLIKYYGAPEGQQQALFDPLHTVTTKARFGLVTVHGEAYRLVDITLRMLAPRELFRAQGFPDDYVIEFAFNGKPLKKSSQIRLAGNSVCEDVAAVIIDANLRRPSATYAA